MPRTPCSRSWTSRRTSASRWPPRTRRWATCRGSEPANKINECRLHEDVDYPGEGEIGTDYLGALLPFDEWSKVTLYNVSFGQGMSLTPLQITRFYGALVNDGVECTPHFLLSKPQSGETAGVRHRRRHQEQSGIDDLTSMLSPWCPEAPARRPLSTVQRGGKNLHGRDLRRGERRVSKRGVQPGLHRFSGRFFQPIGLFCGCQRGSHRRCGRRFLRI